MKKALALSMLASCALYAEVFELGVIEVGVNSQENSSLVSTADSKMMQQNEAKRVTDVAKFTPGVYVNQSYGNRNEKTISIRGFKSTQVPVYIDGIPIYVPYDGNMDLNRFVTGDLSKVMISKGASSVLYGPNALGGL